MLVDGHLDKKELVLILITGCLFNQYFICGIASPQDVKDFKFNETGSM